MVSSLTGDLGGLADIKQVVQKSLVLVLAKQIKFVHDENDGLGGTAISRLQGLQQEGQVL